jgi:hypothetical protein
MWKMAVSNPVRVFGIVFERGAMSWPTTAGWAWLGFVLGSTLCFNQPQVVAQAVAGASYQVRISDYYGQLKRTGYTPLQVTVTRFGPAAKTTETLYAGVSVGRAYGAINREVVSRIDFAAEQTSATVEISVPISEGYRNVAIVSRDVSLNPSGRNLIAAITLPDWLTSRNWGGGSGTSTTGNIGLAYFSAQPMLDTGLHLDSFWHPDWSSRPQMTTGPTVTANASGAMPNFRELFAVTANDTNRLIHDNATIPTPPDQQLSASIRNRFVVAGDFSAIPATWLGLSSVEMCLISVEDLRILANQRPDKLEVIRQWVVAGGRLIVLNCQADFAGLGSIIPNLTSAAATASGSLSALEAGPQQWSMLEETNAERLSTLYRHKWKTWRDEINDQNSQQSWETKFHSNPITEWVSLQNLDKQTRAFGGSSTKIADDAVAAKAPFLFSDYGTGRILAVPNDGTQLQTNDWFRILVALSGYRSTSVFEGIGDRNHSFFGYSGFDYKRLGKPPWILFLILITLFAISVGPVAFVLLKRIGRTHLLLGGVPMIASAITTGIVGYAMIQDGFSFRTTRLSVTWLDSRNQTALTQTTQMVYSGVAPGNFELPLSTAYYDDLASDAYYRTAQSRILSTGDRQVISGTKIQARTKIQVTTFDVHRSTSQLLLSATPDGTKWEVTNQLGFKLELLVVQTPAGIMSAEHVDDGASATLDNKGQSAFQWLSEYEQAGLATKAAIPELLRTEIGWHGHMDRLSTTLKNFFDSSKMSVGSYMAVSFEQPMALSLRQQAYQDEEFHLTVGQYLAMSPLPNIPPNTLPSSLLNTMQPKPPNETSESASSNESASRLEATDESDPAEGESNDRLEPGDPLS